MSTASDRVLRDAVYLSGRDPAMRICTISWRFAAIRAGADMRDADQRSKQVVCIQISSQIAALLARFTSPSIAAWIIVREPS